MCSCMQIFVVIFAYPLQAVVCFLRQRRLQAIQLRPQPRCSARRHSGTTTVVKSINSTLASRPERQQWRHLACCGLASGGARLIPLRKMCLRGVCSSEEAQSTFTRSRSWKCHLVCELLQRFVTTAFKVVEILKPVAPMC